MLYKLWVIRWPIPDTPLLCSLVFGGSFVPKRGSFPIFSLSIWNLYSRFPHFTILSVLYIIPHSFCYRYSKTSAPPTTTFQSGFVMENKITLFQYFFQPIASPEAEAESCFEEKFFFCSACRRRRKLAAMLCCVGKQFFKFNVWTCVSPMSGCCGLFLGTEWNIVLGIELSRRKYLGSSWKLIVMHGYDLF